MTPDELALWHLANRIVGEPASSPCFDCTPAWCEAMRRIGQCNGTPGIPETRNPNPPTREERRRESNRIAAQRFRLRHPGRRRGAGATVRLPLEVRSESNRPSSPGQTALPLTET